MPLLRRRHNGTYILNRQEFLVRIKSITGLRPSNITIYEKAFIHRSATHILDDGTRINNERLEFLGDAVLDTILSDYLFEKFPFADEGKLTKTRSRLVNRVVLNDVALSIGIDKLLISQINRKSPGKNLYGDALEALIGSVFLDKGYSKAKNFIIKKLFDEYLDLDLLIATERDFKSQVFEWAQKLSRSISFDHTENPNQDTNSTLFETTLLIDHETFGEGTGLSKKEAEQEASYNAWLKIRKIGFID